MMRPFVVRESACFRSPDQFPVRVSSRFGCQQANFRDTRTYFQIPSKFSTSGAQSPFHDIIRPKNHLIFRTLSQIVRDQQNMNPKKAQNTVD